MLIWMVLAAFFPCILVVMFSFLTRNKWVGTIVALALIGGSIYKGFFHSQWIIFIDVISLLAGYVIVDTLKYHRKKEDE
ncbi:CsbA family protein [Staphylococcus massiliensis]|uniref:Protein CsbA n=1 Tax=Staphylococcus massiliensis S46 TaxID=1229783 RepID=K9AMA3_9STAP|nr:CsbA family protein [Staphylococcus massiliensis]EKU48508.1 hypothetical protein C273_04835 [Staphylococcus massiliensis S46]MCG3400062.1 CsbA family protein [Staphylococcus massiliensis]MCG3401784.1 CsbA family protein [Staphylococcus massiliensis]MCG3412656.1 CsbA family protein [Staphylococcus massiliensis]POA01517.1 DUF2198 domain-containing protein [Staphylococcus massiliensis CCUG 55927]